MAALYLRHRSFGPTRKRPLLLSNPNAFARAFPPGDASGLTVVFGTGFIIGTPGPTQGQLEIDRTNGSGSAYAYFNVTPANAASSIQTVSADFHYVGVDGLFCRGTLGAVPEVLINGFRIDDSVGPGILRLLRFTNQVVDQSATVNWLGFDSNYYLSSTNPFTYHLVDTGIGGTITAFASAPGHPDTPPVVFGPPITSVFPSGRIGMLSFGVPQSVVYSRYTASWTT